VSRYRRARPPVRCLRTLVHNGTNCLGMWPDGRKQVREEAPEGHSLYRALLSFNTCPTPHIGVLCLGRAASRGQRQIRLVKRRSAFSDRHARDRKFGPV
jgi:hypothetical protein